MKKKNPNKPQKTKKSRKGLWIAALVVVLLVYLGSSSDKENSFENTKESSVISAEDSSIQESEPTDTGQSEPKETKSKFADDQVVNDFIESYNELTNSPFTSVERGNIRTKYHAVSQTYYFELLHANDTGKISVTINETNENADAGVKGMKDAFRDVILVINPSLSEEEIDGCFDDLLHGDLLAHTELDGAAITFVPDKDLSNGDSRGHIQISAQ